MILGIFTIQGMATNVQNNNSKDTLRLRSAASGYIGTWIANVSTNDTIKIKFEKKVMYIKSLDEYFEAIVGSIEWKKNGNVIFRKEIDDYNMVEETQTPLCGSATSDNVLRLTYQEGKECNNIGEVTMKLKDDNTASWSLITVRESRNLDKFKMPAKLIFKRKLV